MRSSNLLDVLAILALLGAVAAGVYMNMGNGVQRRIGASTQKMVGSITHDAKLEDYGADNRVGTEKVRDNLMTHE
jgi:hypothetical protein